MTEEEKMKWQNVFKKFWQENKTTWPIIFLFNILMVWISYVHFNGEKSLEHRAGLHNLLIFINFIFGLWSLWRMNLKMDDYKTLLHRDNENFKPARFILCLALILFVALFPLFSVLPLMCWLETLYFSAFWGKYLGTMICLSCFVQVFACGWAMNLNNRKMFLDHVGENPDKMEGHFLLSLFRSFIDFYFYYMMLACFGLFLYKIFGEELYRTFPNFRLLDVLFCFAAADVMLVKALYELNSKKQFLWSSASTWGMDLPAGIIKVLMVTIVAVTIPAPTEQEAQKMVEYQQKDRFKNIPSYTDIKVQVGECVDGKDQLGKACDIKRMPSGGDSGQDMETTHPMVPGVDPEATK